MTEKEIKLNELLREYSIRPDDKELGNYYFILYGKYFTLEFQFNLDIGKSFEFVNIMKSDESPLRFDTVGIDVAEHVLNGAQQELADMRELLEKILKIMHL